MELGVAHTLHIIQHCQSQPRSLSTSQPLAIASQGGAHNLYLLDDERGDDEMSE
jgi:hypothetical protein